MSNANDLQAQTRNQDVVTAGSLAKAQSFGKGATINVAQGEHLLLDINCASATTTINLPTASSVLHTGVVVDAYVYGDTGNPATWSLVVNAPSNISYQVLNNSTQAAPLVVVSTRSTVATATLTYDQEAGGVGAAFASSALLQIRSCGTVGYTITVTSYNMAVA